MISSLLRICPVLATPERTSTLKPQILRLAPTFHRTITRPLAVVYIDCSSIQGTIDAFENGQFEQLKHTVDSLCDTAVPMFNDQATNSNIRAIQEIRERDMNAVLRFRIYEVGIGFFHVELNLVWTILVIHRGDENDTGSLSYYIRLLRKKRLGGKHPNFYALVSMFRDILDGYMLYCWSTITSSEDKDTPRSPLHWLDNFLNQNPSSGDIKAKANMILMRHLTAEGKPTKVNYGSNQAAQDHQEVESEATSDEAHDSILVNNKLLIRDLLLFFEVRSAISSGDFGRLEGLFGYLTIFFLGAGCKNYANEFLHFIQNLKKDWTPEFALVQCHISWPLSSDFAVTCPVKSCEVTP